MSGYFLASELSEVAPNKKNQLRPSGLYLGSLKRTSVDSNLSDLDIVQCGSKVFTPYGEGVVRRIRQVDSVFEVKMLKWNAVCFLRESDVALVSSKSRWSWTSRYVCSSLLVVADEEEVVTH